MCCIQSWVRTKSPSNRWEEGGWTCAKLNVSCVVCAISVCLHHLSGFSGMQRKHFRYRRWVIAKQCFHTVTERSSEEKKLLCCKPVASVWAAGQTAGGRAAADNATTFCCVVSGRRLLHQWARQQRMELPKKCNTILGKRELFAVH